MALLHITLQPENFYGEIGETASFHVEAVGSNLTYQWQYLSTASGSSWKNSTSTGYNTNTLSIALTSARNGQKYRCVVKSGSNTVTSEAATLIKKNAISKVVYKNRTLIDLTEDTVTASSMLSGVKAHSKDGTQITGNIASKTSTDMTVSGAQVTAPAGYYASASSKSVASGSVTVGTPTINTTTGVVTGTASVTAGYVSGTPSSKTLALTTQAAKTVTPTESSQTAVAKNVYTTGAVTVGAISNTYIGSGVTKKAAATYNTSTTDQTITSGQYLNGAQTIKAVTTSNISAENIKDGVVVKVGDANNAGRIKNVTGTYKGTSTTDATATAANIASGKTAYVASGKVTGTYVPYISFANKTIATSAWTSDSTYSDYPYKATITCSGATADMFPYVEFSDADAKSNLFFEGAASGSNSVTVYASAIPTATITIPTITFYKRS